MFKILTKLSNIPNSLMKESPEREEQSKAVKVIFGHNLSWDKCSETGDRREGGHYEEQHYNIAPNNLKVMGDNKEKILILL